MIPFYIEVFRSGCTIVYSKSSEDAIRFAKSWFGTFSEPKVRPATSIDISWVKSMGGIIHES